MNIHLYINFQRNFKQEMKKRAICKTFHSEALIEETGTRERTQDYSIGTRQESQSDLQVRIRHSSEKYGHTKWTPRQRPYTPDTPDSTTTTTKLEF